MMAALTQWARSRSQAEPVPAPVWRLAGIPV